MSEEQREERTAFRQWVDNLLHVSTDDPVRFRRGRLVSLVIVVSLGIALLWLMVGGVSSLLTMRPVSSGTLGRLAATAVILAATYVLNRRSASPFAGLVLALTALGGSLLALLVTGPLTTYVIGLTVPVLIAGLLGPPASAFVLATLAGVAYGWLNVLSNPNYLAEVLTGAAGESFVVYLNLYIIAALGWLFSQMAGRAIRETHARIQELLARQKTLEGQLERRTRDMRAATNVARAVAGSRELTPLLQESVQMVRQFFGFDVVQIFLIDAPREEALLQASTSPMGRQMVDRGFGLQVGSASSVGQAAERRQPVIGDKRSIDTLSQHIDGSRDERSEVAIPFVVGGEVIGVLHLQSEEKNAFDQDALPSLEALADQLAVAIANARVYEEAQRNMRELSQLSREASERGWRTFLVGREKEDRVYRHGHGDSAWPDRQEVIAQRVIAKGGIVLAQAEREDAFSHLAVPMVLRKQVVGVVGVEADGIRRWSQEDVSILERIAERSVLAIENARLFEQAQRTAQREQLINSISSRLERAPDLRSLLEGVAAELGQALGTDQVYAEFTLPESQEGGASSPARSDNGTGRKNLPRNGEESGDDEHEEVNSRSDAS